MVGSGFGNKSPRSRFVGFILDEKLNGINRKSACDSKVLEKPTMTKPDVFMYEYNQIIDVSLFFLKYEIFKNEYGFLTVKLNESDNKIISNLYINNTYNTANMNYFICKEDNAFDFKKLPEGNGKKVLLFNCGSFALIDYTNTDDNIIHRSNLQKASYIKFRKNVVNKTLISIPDYGLKGDAFYGLFVY